LITETSNEKQKNTKPNKILKIIAEPIVASFKKEKNKKV